MPKSRDIKMYDLLVIDVYPDRVLLDATNGGMHITYFEIVAESQAGDGVLIVRELVAQT